MTKELHSKESEDRHTNKQQDRECAHIFDSDYDLCKHFSETGPASR